jgi:hypothetical protein
MLLSPRAVSLSLLVALASSPAAAAGDVETETATLATGAAVGGLVGGAIFSAAGLSAALFEEEPATATVFVGLAFAGALLGPAIGTSLAAFLGSIDPWLSAAAVVGATTVGLAGGWLGAMLGFPLGVLFFGPATAEPPFTPGDYAIFATTVTSTAVHTALAAGLGSVVGYGGTRLLLGTEEE